MGRQPFGGIVSMQHLTSQEAFEAGDLEIARTWLTAFDQWLDGSGAVLGRAENAVLWAHYYQAAGDHAQACELATRALKFASDPRQPFALIAAHRTLGQLDSAVGRYGEAEQHLRESLALADACAAPFERALALLAIAKLQAAKGDNNDARASLVEVVRLCEPLGALSVLDRASALLAELNASEHSAGKQGELSPREIDVLRLAAKGMTDREIAASLFISPRTVTTHVTHILNKLGVNTRTEAAAYAVREGLI
jgi:DNA-binding CsgD family transcriptional regulator